MKDEEYYELLHLLIETLEPEEKERFLKMLMN
jgi:hypothetical protein